MTPDESARIAPSPPGAEPRERLGTFDFRVQNKIFATLPMPGWMRIRLGPERIRALISIDPETRVANPGAWGEGGSIWIALDRI